MQGGSSARPVLRARPTDPPAATIEVDTVPHHPVGRFGPRSTLTSRARDVGGTIETRSCVGRSVVSQVSPRSTKLVVVVGPASRPRSRAGRSAAALPGSELPRQAPGDRDRRGLEVPGARAGVARSDRLRARAGMAGRSGRRPGDAGPRRAGGVARAHGGSLARLVIPGVGHDVARPREGAASPGMQA